MPHAHEAETTGAVSAADGTTLGYRQRGSGPGLVILHGGGRAAHHYRGLAACLADRYTVYIPDRRGRGLSGPIGADYSMAVACDDVRALVEATGAALIFGHSGGGAIALEAALTLPLASVAVYDPAVSIDRSLPTAWLAGFERALEAGDPAAAMAIFLHALDMNWMSRVPRRVLTPLFRLMLRGTEGREIIELLRTIGPEMRLIEPLESHHERYRALQAPTLLLGGGKSPMFLRAVLPTLARTIPAATLIELPEFDHSAPEEGGAPRIAARIKDFFAAPTAARQTPVV